MNADTQEAPATAAAAESAGPTRREPSKGPNGPAKPKAKATKPKAAKKSVKVKAKTKTGGKSTDALVEAAKRYRKDTKVKTAKGSPSVDCDDKMAKALRGATLDEVYKQAAKALREPEADLRKRYKHLNPGMQRMNLGNRMRAAQ